MMINCKDPFRNFRENLICNIILLGVFVLHFASLCNGTLGNVKLGRLESSLTWNKIGELSHDYGGTYLAFTILSFLVLILTLVLLLFLPAGKIFSELFAYWRLSLFGSALFSLIAWANWFDNVSSIKSILHKEASIKPGSGIVMLIFVTIIEIGVLLLDVLYLSNGKPGPMKTKSKATNKNMELPVAQVEALAYDIDDDYNPW